MRVMLCRLCAGHGVDSLPCNIGCVLMGPPSAQVCFCVECKINLWWLKGAHKFNHHCVCTSGVCTSHAVNVMSTHVSSPMVVFVFMAYKNVEQGVHFSSFYANTRSPLLLSLNLTLVRSFHNILPTVKLQISSSQLCQ